MQKYYSAAGAPMVRCNTAIEDANADCK